MSHNEKLKRMIDERRIEEAAINKCGFISSEFYSGAKWAINEFLKDLLHPASEEPRKGGLFLYQTSYNGKFYYYTNYIDDILQTYPDWSSYVRHVRVVQWLYIDDLIPKEGGEK